PGDPEWPAQLRHPWGERAARDCAGAAPTRLVATDRTDLRWHGRWLYSRLGGGRIHPALALVQDDHASHVLAFRDSVGLLRLRHEQSAAVSAGQRAFRVHRPGLRYHP